MSASVSIQSSDNHLNANSNTINKTPDLNQQSKDPDENTHGYFIPLVMGIVLGIIIVATFYSEEFNKLVTGVASTDQAYELSSEANSRLLASSSSTDTADSAVIAEATVAAKASNEVTTSAAEPAGAGSTSTTPDTSSAETVSGNYVNPQLYIATSQEYRAPVTARQNNYAPYAPPMPYGMPEQLQQDYNNTLEERRRAYEEATQARREHMIKMHEYRAAVEKRIEQDRQDMYKRRLETRQQKQRERDELMDRIEQIEKSSVNRPI